MANSDYYYIRGYATYVQTQINAGSEPELRWLMDCGEIRVPGSIADAISLDESKVSAREIEMLRQSRYVMHQLKSGLPAVEILCSDPKISA